MEVTIEKGYRTTSAFIALPVAEFGATTKQAISSLLSPPDMIYESVQEGGDRGLVVC